MRYAFQSPSTNARAALGSLISKFAVMLDVAMFHASFPVQSVQLSQYNQYYYIIFGREKIGAARRISDSLFCTAAKCYANTQCYQGWERCLAISRAWQIGARQSDARLIHRAGEDALAIRPKTARLPDRRGSRHDKPPSSRRLYNIISKHAVVNCRMIRGQPLGAGG